MSLKPKGILLCLVVILLVGDAGLFVSGKSLLVDSDVKKTVFYQGDIVLIATPERVGPDYTNPMNSTYCTYWNGLYLKHLGGFHEGAKCPLIL